MSVENRVVHRYTFRYDSGIVRWAPRTLDRMNTKIREVLPEGLDGFITHLCLDALRQGRSSVSILDFGCGEGMAFASNFVRPTASTPLLNNFLEAHPDFHLTVVGVTDAKTEVEFGRVAQIIDPDVPSVNRHVYRVGYTVVHNQQRLSDCLAGLTSYDGSPLTQFDFVFAYASLLYFWPASLAELVNDMVDSLRGGGVLIASSYVPGATYHGQFDEDDQWLVKRFGPRNAPNVLDIDYRLASIMYYDDIYSVYMALIRQTAQARNDLTDALVTDDRIRIDKQ